MAIALVVLAAGQGTRMNSDLPKVLHPLGGAPLLAHALQAGAALEPERTIVITGHGAGAVEKAGHELDSEAIFVFQEEQLGTGHAVRMTETELRNFEGDVLVLYGDTPFVTPDTLTRMAEARQTHDVVVLGFEAADPGRYGRLIMSGNELQRIVEFKDANDEERAQVFSGARVPDHVGGAGVAGEAGGAELAERVSGQGLGEVAERLARHDLGLRGQVPQPECVAVAGQGVACGKRNICVWLTS